MILYALVIGAISYPIIFAIDDGFSHLNIYNKWERHLSGYFNWGTASEEAKDKRLEKFNDLKSQSRRLGWRGYSIHSFASNYHEDKYQDAAKNAIWPSIVTIIIASIALILGRYIIKTAKWVETTSRKET